ncbi:hypothetical protein LBMAG55_19510 [Verrucomicrobiota bacterium]|jgi:hypothetical protein|nr:hypothetical protein LBMAG55_19510 [Verrucomicrobiota bacterium]
MKSLILSLFSIGVLVAAEPAKPATAPRPGRALEAPGVRADFVILQDRKATVTFVDEAGNPAARGDRTVAVKVDGKDVALEAQPNGFVTKEPLPAKEPAPIVVQIRAKADAKPANFRITLNTAICAECKRPEYGCICGH